MEILNNVNDDELRQGLVHYGFPHIPVTETTRPLLLKKLYSQITSKSNNSYKLQECIRLSSNFKRFNSTGEFCNQSFMRKCEKEMKEPFKLYETKNFLASDNVQNLPNENRRKNNVCNKIFNQLLPSESEEESDHFNFSTKCYSFPQKPYKPSHSNLYGSQNLRSSCHQLVNKIFGRCYGKEKSNNENRNISTSVSCLKVHKISNIIYGLKQCIVSSVFMSVLILLFIMIISSYICTTTYKKDSINWDETEFEICKTNDSQAFLAEPTLNCIERNHIESAIATTQLLLTLLHQEAASCFDSSSNTYVSTKDLLSQLSKLDSNSNIMKLITDIHNAEYLINKNMNWDIRHVNANGKEILFEDVIKKRENKDNYFSLKEAQQLLRCTLKNKLQSFFIIIGSAFLLVIIIIMIRFCYKYVQRRKMKKLLVYEDLKNEILNELLYISRNCPSFESREISVNDLQEKIIPINNSSDMLSVWNKTIIDLERNDNRVRFGISTKNGEEFKTIKWISNKNKKFVDPDLLKLWHSPAFNKANKILNPPTSCLKIRQMFDSSEIENPNLKQVIEDAILEKVGRGCKIFEIQFDTNSCCVYVRCATEKDAGVVHDEINGWWFDKRLVSIKFLRLQRYLARFPKSSGGPNCLLPSNVNNLSMSQFLYR